MTALSNWSGNSRGGDEKARLASLLSSPRDFARLIQIMDKWSEMVPLHHNRVQRHFLRHCSLGKRGVTDWVVKSRQVGLTTCIVAECLRLAYVRPHRILTMLDKDENTAGVREMIQIATANMPSFALSDGTVYAPTILTTDNVSTVRFANGSRWKTGTAGARTTGRSTTLDIFHTSETAYFRDGRRVISGAQQAAAQAIWRVHESTANGAQGLFFEAVRDALKKRDPRNRVHFYPWWWAPEYSEPIPEGTKLELEADELRLMDTYGLTLEQIWWRRLKKAELRQDFDREYPETIKLAFTTSGLGYFGTLHNGIFTAPLDAGPQKGHTYVAGLDWGQMHDYTVLIIIDATTLQMVAMLRIRKESWKAMRAEVVRLLKKWDVTLVRPEANSMGSSQIEALRDDLANEGLGTAVWSFTMSETSKMAVMQTYRTALQEGGLKLLPIPVLRAELEAAQSKLTAKGWTVESPRDEEEGHGDTVVAGALALLAATGVAC